MAELRPPVATALAVVARRIFASPRIPWRTESRWQEAGAAVPITAAAALLEVTPDTPTDSRA
jgi:hypothetical protein